MPLQDDFDIASNIKALEKSKCELLSSVSDLFDSLLHSNDQSENLKNRADIIAQIIITSFLISSRLSISNSELTSKILNRLRLQLIEDNNLSNRELAFIYNFFETKKFD